MLSKRIHPEWHKFFSDSDHSLIQRDIAKERRKGSLLGISAGIEASQAAEDTGCYTSSITAKATMSGKLSQHEKLHCILNFQYLEPSILNYTPLKRIAIYFSSSILFDSFREDLNHKHCPRFLQKNDVRHCQPSSAKVKKYIVQINTQYSVLAINMF